jgi:hypothetical protein
MEEGPNFDYKVKFEEPKQKITQDELIKIEALEQILDKIKFEDIPKKLEEAYKIKDEETAYKMELDYIHFQRDRGLDENAEINLDEADEYTIQKYKQKKKKIREEKIKKIDEENSKFKDLIKYTDDYLPFNNNEECYYYEAYEENDYDEEENFYESEEDYEKEKNNKESNILNEEKNLNLYRINDDDDEEEMKLELDLENFKLVQNDFININDLVNNFVDELHSLEQQKNIEKKKQDNLTFSNEEEKIYFYEYGSKYKKLLVNDFIDCIKIDNNYNELYDFFSNNINKEQIIEIFEWIL